MGDAARRLARRQIWARPTTTHTSTVDPTCTPFLLPSNGVLNLNRTYSITLTENVVYQPACTGAVDSSQGDPSAVIDSKDPFYSSTSPQLYAIGCMTVVSYVLVIILLITPRTFYIGGPGGGGNFLGRHGGSYSGSSSVVGVGGRPWLQKVAALSVAVSLTIATVDSFRVAEQQYNYGYMDATALTNEVLDGTEIRIVRVISSTFLWLAQVQTLIRLFPRHKEKVMIKWAGFALIVLDTIFAILDNFVAHGSSTHPRLFDDAIPALSYLFELALNLLYAAWVIFYSLSKHRFAFFHPKMRNICLVALLSLVAVFIPVVFFVMDISQPDVAGWGEYIRWVGSAAASVVVWEWVERIEALERDERKDGILGREIFDGDEMLEITPSEEIDWPRQSGGHGNDCGRGTGACSSSPAWGGLSHRPLRRTRVGFQRNSRARRDVPGSTDHENVGSIELHRTGPAHPTPPPAALTPVSRADTTSAASTVYYVRYHPVTSPTPPVQTASAPPEEGHYQPKEAAATTEHQSSSNSSNNLEMGRNEGPWATVPLVQDARWFSIANLFRRRRTSPPQEVATAQEQEHSEAAEVDGLDEKHTGSWHLRSRMNQVLSLHRSKSPQESDGRGTARPLTVTVIPPRGRTQQTWSPQRSDDSQSYVGDSSRRTSSSQNTLPVRVITTQPRRAAPWPSPATGGGEEGHSHRLRYDPDAAALVGAGPDLVVPVVESEGATRNSSVRGTSSGNETLVVSDEEQGCVANSPGNVVGAADQCRSPTAGPEIQPASTRDLDGQPGSDDGSGRGPIANSAGISSVQSQQPLMPEHSSVVPTGRGEGLIDPAGYGRRC
ncbi:hypothetical protein VTN77DRAFT_5183 [Rasamsonia byssochlamydoides]|uniref:uncharacterized protein n=1 Tax=Rasamsonia byssochlamydoides TaxID=89139 RepID=UPI0037448C34